MGRGTLGGTSANSSIQEMLDSSSCPEVLWLSFGWLSPHIQKKGSSESAYGEIVHLSSGRKDAVTNSMLRQTCRDTFWRFTKKVLVKAKLEADCGKTLKYASRLKKHEESHASISTGIDVVSLSSLKPENTFDTVVQLGAGRGNASPVESLMRKRVVAVAPDEAPDLERQREERKIKEAT